MRVEFGWFLDRAPWAFRSPGLNTVRVGRQGLTQLLQTRLGTTRPEQPNSHITRVQQYLARLEAADRPDAWFHGSFEVDPWSTAQELLWARDELVANGWDGSLPAGQVSELVRCLAGLESSDLPLDPALADDVAALPEALESPLPLGISVIELQHPRPALPGIWRRILAKLESRGVRIVEPEDGFRKAPQITVLEAETEWEAAEHAARWLAAGVESPGNTASTGGTAVVASQPTGVLDQYLAGRGLPRLGVGGKSAWRAQDQIIPLFLEVIWGPVNVQLLGEFLSLPVFPGPVRAKAARALQKALAQEPGTGGPAWQQALAEIAADAELGPELAGELDGLFSTGLLLEDGNVSGAHLADKCQWLAGRLKALVPFNEALSATAEQLQTLLALVAGLPRVSRRDLRRMVSSVVAGSSSPLAAAEAAPWLRLNHLYELMDDVSDVLWWGFQAGTISPGRRWDDGDRRALAGIGVELPPAEALAALTVAQTLAAARRCRNLLIVQVRQQDGERVDGNPLLEALVADQPEGPGDSDNDATPLPIAKRVESRKRCPEDLFDGDLWTLAGRQARLVPVPARAAAAPPSSFELGPRHDLAPDTLSFTQLSTLVGCALAWVLEKKVRLRVAEADEVPTGNRMIGTFTHKVVEELHHDLAAVHRAVPEPGEIDAKIDALLPRMASELLLPGAQSRLKHLRAVVQETVLKFFRTLSRAGVVIQEMEQDFDKPLVLDIDGAAMTVPVNGKADVVGIDTDGRRVVVDLKWSNRDSYRIREVREGRAAQLALYQWALDDGGGLDAPTAYYLLKQGTFASTHAAFGNPLEAAQTPDELWQKTVRAASFSVAEVVNGRIAAGPRRDAELEAAGQPSGEQLAEQAGRFHAKPPCNFCKFDTLCGLKGDFS
ncbi:PD-(D/E)XK nuclease family protein [Arthrobacter sp. I2-34]|uniref:PD-(D/E)XK nuclease family protein n=1 Tax=Arthrobacter hankyongi TaxID=2904801 RepID=A0ABS9L2L9_9MICC|nr:PD-(D/E)XK nuclease family protein [Arthrobacter hankyongi]MCG2620890.1 PD-(D/E)XK nuclease family protein [Arthrobacter hankyongi]